ncbi:hypothetical protein COLO4_32092 [Corchorus olitorius]|uniref:Uncharacterized protein n=1 Tax=Corchorus olitorius TaxID=93759 RepID=A0A1R3H1Q5_9ROSI|nr:hypothetical protein COLO4_32092 [Corchorus olitorius]
MRPAGFRSCTHVSADPTTSSEASPTTPMRTPKLDVHPRRAQFCPSDFCHF